MKNLYIKAAAGLLNLVVILAVVLFLSAWTLRYRQAWVFIAVFFVSVLAITLYLANNDPGLLERRVQAGPVAEKEKGQQIIQSLASVAFIGIFILSALDHRFGWSSVPLIVTIAGDLLVAFGLLFVFFVFRENSFTSAVIEVGKEQKIVTTGPYAFVRHPMYMGALIMLLGVPPALDSFWGLLMVLLVMLVIILRLLDEEKFLTKNLSGYSEYKNKVRYRLIPFVW